MKPFSALPIILGAALLASSARAEPPPAFDATRYMRVSEVREGMTGYGLSVFKGTQIARFDVKVLAVLHDFNPKYDVVLVDCHGQNLEHTGSIAGMSGSPIYLRDDQGRDRMIGAFAYGWPLMKDPIGGVQPIEYMLALPDEKAPATLPASTDSAKVLHVVPVPAGRSHWSLSEVPGLMGDRAAGRLGVGIAIPSGLLPQGRLSSDGRPPQLEPLATPLMTMGMSSRLLEEFAPAFAARGLVSLQAGGVSGGAANPQSAAKPARMEAGSVLAIPLLTGDAEMAAIGTCTDVVGNRVYGFGHPFNNEGSISLPMGTGEINGVIANLSTSFKLGALTSTTGTLLTDQTVGVAGLLGAPPAMAPMDIKLIYTDGSGEQSYHFNVALHPKFTPLIAAAALGASLTGVRDLPQYHTVDYDLNMDFSDGRRIHLVNSDVNVSASDLFNEVGIPIVAAADNPFERVGLKKISGTVKVTPEAREARLLSITVPRLKYQPGETAKIYVTYRPFRASEAILPVDFELPRDLRNGTYELAITDWQTYMQGEFQTRPFRFTAESIDEVFAVLNDVLSIRHNAIYVQLHNQADGVAVGRTAMPHLPSSRRQVLLDAGLSDTTQFISSTVKIVPTDLVMNGSATFTITIDREGRVEANPHPTAKPAAHSPAVNPKAEEPKPAPVDKGTAP